MEIDMSLLLIYRGWRMLVDAMLHNQKPLSGRKDSFPQLYHLPEDHLQLTALFGNYLGWRKLSCPRFQLPETACTQWLTQLGNTKAWSTHCNLGQVCGVAEASVGTALLFNLSLYPICFLLLPSTGFNPKSIALQISYRLISKFVSWGIQPGIQAVRESILEVTYDWI